MGKGKDKLDLVDPNLAIAEFVSMFGPYTKFVCSKASASGKSWIGRVCIVYTPQL